MLPAAARGFLTGPVVQGAGVDWQRPAIWSFFDPTLLSCAKKRGVEPPRRNCFLRWRVNTQGSADPCAIPGVLGMRCLTTGASFYGFCQHSLSGLQLQPGLQLIQRSSYRAANLAVFRRRKAFLLCKNPCGGTAVGIGLMLQF